MQYFNRFVNTMSCLWVWCAHAASDATDYCHLPKNLIFWRALLRFIDDSVVAYFLGNRVICVKKSICDGYTFRIRKFYYSIGLLLSVEQTFYYRPNIANILDVIVSIEIDW